MANRRAGRPTGGFGCTRVLRITVACASMAMFLGGLALFHWFMGRRDFLYAAASLIVAFMAIPFVAEGRRREQMAAGLTMLCLVLGLIAGGAIYVGMFHFSWWQSIFGNNKTGPMGLAVFVTGFAAAGFLCGRRLVRIAGFAENRHQ